MRKSSLIVAGLICMVGLTACGEKKAEPVVTTMAEVVVETTVAEVEEDTLPDIQTQIEQDREANEVEKTEETSLGADEDLETEVGAEKFKDVGTLTSIDGDVYTIDMNGMMVEAYVSDMTVVDVTEDAIGKRVLLVSDGVQTRSIPAQMHTIFEIKVMEETDNTEEVNSEDGELVNYLESTESAENTESVNVDINNTEAAATEASDVEFTGTIVEISDGEILFEVADRGNIIANISDDTKVEDGLVVGDTIIVESSQVMTMSEPGILPEVYEIRRAE